MRGIIRLVIIMLAIIKSSFFWRRKKAEPRRILIVHDLLLGDTLLLAPLMKRLHEKHPHSQKYILAKPLFVPLFKTKPYGFIALKYNPKSFFDLFKIFLKGPYDQTFVAGDNRFSWLARALGSMTPLYDSGSNGNGKPEYLGSIFNMEVMLGSAILRADMKGVAALVQTWVS